jgi:hypothetical protein
MDLFARALQATKRKPALDAFLPPRMCIAQTQGSYVKGKPRRSGMLGTKKLQGRYGQRVTRVEPPTLEEAIAAAQGLTDDVECQIEIASQLMGMPEEQVRPEVLKISAETRQAERAPLADRVLNRSEGAKVIVVERRRPRLAAR